MSDPAGPIPIPIPPSTVADARSRAVRTFLQGLGLDVAVAVTSGLAVALGDVHWTRAWWALQVGLLAKTAAQTAVAYLHRRLGPPPSA